MSHQTPSLSSRATEYLPALRVIVVLSFFLITAQSRGQRTQQLTERENLGLKGPVRSVLTAVTRPHPDPRPETRRKLFVQGNPDWEVFDIEGRRIEFSTASTPEGVAAISTCTFGADGSKTCIDSAGRHQQSGDRRSILPDGSREVTYFLGSKVLSREVTHFDKKGTAVAFRAYRSNGKLSSEDFTLPDNEDESKIYDESGKVIYDVRTRMSENKSRVDRWSYDSEGHLVWNIAIDSDGALLSDWYDIGFKPKVSSSDSLGICRPRLCVYYKFDDEGSGRLEKTVQHTQGEGNLEPDGEEHYNFAGILDERAEIKYERDGHGNWTSRSVSVWDSDSNLMIEIERDTRTIEYY